MKITGIISEYNPIHNGHIHHINMAKTAIKSDALVCIMSGNFTERGDIAILDKHTRAVHAIKAGADMVIELPLIYAVNCAEFFAKGACHTLSALSDDITLSFGSESGNIEELEKIAKILNSESKFEKQTIQQNLKSGASYAKAKYESLPINISTIASKPNNILAVEYLKYAKKFGFHSHTIKREDNYNNENLTGKFASASAIRCALENKQTANLKNYMPNYVLNALSYPIFNDSLSDMILYRISTMSAKDIKQIYGVSEGLENRIKSAQTQSRNYNELINNIKTKRYTMARIKRILLNILFGLTKENAKLLLASPPYIRVLAIKQGREDLLSEISKRTDNLILKLSDTDKINELCKKSVIFDEIASSIYSVASKKQTPFNCIFVK